jgi:HD-GYP domain-containing protein (c-di-GMP phosphodiesterase class II)
MASPRPTFSGIVRRETVRLKEAATLNPYPPKAQEAGHSSVPGHQGQTALRVEAQGRTEKPACETERCPERDLCQTAQQEAARILEAVRQGTPCEMDPLRGVAREMVVSLETGDGLLLRALEPGETHLDLPRHMVNVAVFTIKIGQGMGCPGAELQELAVAACLHDVGMLIVPRSLLEKPGDLSPDELDVIHRHPEAGSRSLQALGPEFDWVANVILQEHERQDGSGYPRGLKGDEIHEYARIIGLADVYEVLSHSRPYRRRPLPFSAIKEVVNGERHRFSDRALKGFIRGLPPFPAGTLVRLSSMDLARVVATTSAFPWRPVVEIIRGPSGETVDPPRSVDLANHPLLYIVDAFPAEVPS